MELISCPRLHQAVLRWRHTDGNCCEKVKNTSSKSPHCGRFFFFLNQCYPICIISIASISFYISERLPMSNQLRQLQLAHKSLPGLHDGNGNKLEYMAGCSTNWFKDISAVPKFPCSFLKLSARRFSVTLCPCEWLECSRVISLLSH